MKNTIKIAVIALLTTLLSQTTNARNVRVLLDEGIYLQHTKSDYANALSAYEAAIEKGHSDDSLLIQAFVNAIGCCLELEQTDRAKELFKEMNDRYGQSPHLIEERTQIALSLFDTTKQVSDLLGLKLSAGDSDRPLRVDVPLARELCAKGWKAFDETRYTDAKLIFIEALQANVYEEDGWNGLGWAGYNLQEFTQAHLAFERAVELNGKNPGALNGLGWAMQQQGKLQAAIEYWERSVEAFPNASAARVGLAQTYLELENYDQAATHAAILLKSDPSQKEIQDIYNQATQAGGKALSIAAISGFDYLDPVPWENFELCRYELVNGAGLPAGNAITRTQLEEGTNGGQWQMQASYLITPINQTVYDAAVVDQKSFRPLSGDFKYFSVPMFELDFELEGEQLVMSWKNQNGSEKKQTALPLDGIASGQIFSYMRRLPQQADFSMSVWLPSPLTPLSQGRFTVGELETIEVPAGRFSCRKVKVEAIMDGPVSINQTAWIEEGGLRRILKYDAGQWGMELQSTTVEYELVEVAYTNEPLGITFPLPENWYVGSHNSSSKRDLHLSLLSPRMEVIATFLSVNFQRTSPEEVFQADYEILKKHFSNYRLREGTKNIRTINGNPAVSYIADYTEGGVPMVEYRCYYLGKRVHWCLFRVRQDRLEIHRAAIEQMIEGFQGE